MAEPTSTTAAEAASSPGPGATSSTPTAAFTEVAEAAPKPKAAVKKAPMKQSYSTDPTLYIYTSLTAGSSHIVTATSRMETILRANRVPFKGIDLATDEKARMLWGRRAGKDPSGRVRKIPGLVQMGLVIGDLVEVEEWNEYGELKQHVKIVAVAGHKVAPKRPANPKAAASKTATTKATLAESSKAPAKSPTVGAAPTGLPMRGIAEEAAQKAKDINKASVKKAVAKKPEEKTVGVILPPAMMEEILNPSIPPAPHDLKKGTPISVSPPSNLDGSNSLGFGDVQSPNSTAWRSGLEPSPQMVKKRPSQMDLSITPQIAEATTGRFDFLQSPTSSAWKTADTFQSIVSDGGETSGSLQSIMMQAGAEVSPATEEEIKKVEDAATIKEESEEESDDTDEPGDGVETKPKNDVKVAEKQETVTMPVGHKEVEDEEDESSDDEEDESSEDEEEEHKEQEVDKKTAYTKAEVKATSEPASEKVTSKIVDDRKSDESDEDSDESDEDDEDESTSKMAVKQEPSKSEAAKKPEAVSSKKESEEDSEISDESESDEEEEEPRKAANTEKKQAEKPTPSEKEDSDEDDDDESDDDDEDDDDEDQKTHQQTTIPQRKPAEKISGSKLVVQDEDPEDDSDDDEEEAEEEPATAEAGGKKNI